MTQRPPIGTEDRPNISIGIHLGVAVSVLVSIYSTFSDWSLKQQPRTDVHNVVAYERVAQKVMAVTPKIATMGYVTNSIDLHFPKFQYAMAPVLLSTAPTGPLVLGYFPSTPSDKVAAIAGGHGLRVLNSLGDDAYLLARP